MTMRAVSAVLFVLLSVLVFAPSDTTVGRSSYIEVRQSGFTHVSGLITQNTTWTAGASPYVVVGDVIVDINVFLTIDPGVSVKFTNGTNLIIDGCLIAQGNSTHAITFTSNSTTPKSGDWGTVNIRQYSTITNLFDHVQMEYASTAVTLAASCNVSNSFIEQNNNGISLQNAANIHIEYVQIANNTNGISGSTNQNVTVKNSKLTMNGVGLAITLQTGGALLLENNDVTLNGGGLALTSGDITPSGGRFSIRNCTIAQNTNYGASVDRLVDFDDCRILANGGDGITGTATSWASIRNSNVSDNAGTGLAGSYYSAGIHADNCIFMNNTNGLAIGGTAINCSVTKNRASGITFAGWPNAGGCSIYNCSISDNDCGITGSGVRAGISISGCNISNNRKGIDCESFQGGVGLDGSCIRNNSEYGIRARDSGSATNSLIVNNTIGVYQSSFGALNSIIANNTVGVFQSTFTASDTTIANNSLFNIQGGTCQLENCSIYNSLTGIQTQSATIHYSNICNHTQYNVENTGTNDINATDNWWGTMNETAISEHIYDFYDNTSLGRVFFKPYLTNPVEIDVFPPQIGSVSQMPSSPNYYEAVLVSAAITDDVAVDTAQLSYSCDASWQNVSMSRVGVTYAATIPAQPYGTTVQYKIYSNDTNGNWATSDVYSYTVVDTKAPQILSVKASPTCPYLFVPSNVTRANEPTLITANISEPAAASGMAKILFSYRVDSGKWWNTSMDYNPTSGLWTVTVPAQSNATNIVELFIEAYDNAGNVATSPVQVFSVRALLGGDINGDGKVDMKDIGYAARHYGEHYP